MRALLPRVRGRRRRPCGGRRVAASAERLAAAVKDLRIRGYEWRSPWTMDGAMPDSARCRFLEAEAQFGTVDVPLIINAGIVLKGYPLVW